MSSPRLSALACTRMTICPAWACGTGTSRNSRTALPCSVLIQYDFIIPLRLKTRRRRAQITVRSRARTYRRDFRTPRCYKDMNCYTAAAEPRRSAACPKKRTLSGGKVRGSINHQFLERDTMNKLILSALVSAGLAATAPLSLAQSAGDGPQMRHDAQHHRQHEPRPFSMPGERIEARLAYLKTALKITDAQQPQ